MATLDPQEWGKDLKWRENEYKIKLKDVSAYIHKDRVESFFSQQKSCILISRE